MTRKKIFIYIFIVALLFLSGICYAYAPVVRSSAISISSFDSIGNNTYVDNLLSTSDTQEITELLSQAKARIIDTFGDYTVEPVVIIIGSPENNKKYGLYGAPGRVYTSPWNHYVVIDGMRPDINVMAHELLHVEVHHRLGYWTQLTNFPRWLNEGIAMQVDYRPQYAIDNVSLDRSEFLRITRLDKTSEFWKGDRELIISNYAFSKKIVAEALSLNDGMSLYDKLDQVRSGESPQSAFSIHELQASFDF